MPKRREKRCGDIAEVSWALFQAYQEAEFTRGQAMVLLKNGPVDATAQLRG